MVSWALRCRDKVGAFGFWCQAVKGALVGFARWPRPPNHPLLYPEYPPLRTTRALSKDFVILNPKP